MHPLCDPDRPVPARFWGPERLDPTAWRALAALLDSADEIEALIVALAGVGSIVDVGGGTGLITQALAARVAPVTIVEPSAEQRAHLPAGLTVVAGRAGDVPVPDRGADAAIATWVLQYTDEPTRAVAELARIARDRVVIVQAAPGNDLVEVYLCEAAIAGQPSAHHGWLAARAATVLEAAGFAVTLARVPTPVRLPTGGPGELADLLARLHFTGHPRLSEMRTASTALIAARGAAAGWPTTG